MPSALPLIVLLSLACSRPGPAVGEAPVDLPSPAPSTEEPSLDCASLDWTACREEPRCSLIRGLGSDARAALSRTDQAYVSATFTDLGCRSSEQACKEVESYARAPSGGDCYELGNSCVPPGWVPCKPEPAAD
jgi:hypothetical protein